MILGDPFRELERLDKDGFHRSWILSYPVGWLKYGPEFKVLREGLDRHVRTRASEGAKMRPIDLMSSVIGVGQRL
jgi:hypothetical protein